MYGATVSGVSRGTHTAATIAATLRECLTNSRLSEVADILAIAERYGLLGGIVGAHPFALGDGAEGIGLALSGNGLTNTQRTYSPEGPSPEESPCVAWELGCVRLVFIDLDCRVDVAWLSAQKEANRDRC